MDKFTSELFAQPLPLTAEQICVYLCMRSDIVRNETVTARMAKASGALCSGLSCATIAARLNIPELTVAAHLRKLSDLKWIKLKSDTLSTTLQLGTKDGIEITWYCDVPEPPAVKEKPEGTLDQIRALAQEKSEQSKVKRVRISSKAKRKLVDDTIGGLVSDEKASTTIVNHIVNETQRLYKTRPTFDDRRIKFVYANRFIKYCGDLDSAKEVVTWTFENWDSLKKPLKLDMDYPQLQLFATKSICDRLSNYIAKGIPTEKVDRSGLATRADSQKIEEAPDEGWGDANN